MGCCSSAAQSGAAKQGTIVSSTQRSSLRLCFPF